MKTLCSFFLVISLLFVALSQITASPSPLASNASPAHKACPLELSALKTKAAATTAPEPSALASWNAATENALQDVFEWRDAAIVQYENFLGSALSVRYAWVWMFVVLLAVKRL